MAAVESRVALWVGCYTSEMGGSGEGIVALGRDTEGGYAALGAPAPVASPSFLARHPSQPVLYAASESAAQVRAFRHEVDGRLNPVGQVGTAGDLVCHVAVDPDGAFLVASCWGDGSVFAYELGPDGSLGRRHVAPPSEDPSGENRQSRAHSCLMMGGGRMVTAEMGHDLLRFWRFTPGRGFEAHGSVALPRGSGPRHFARSAHGFVYVNTEYSGEVAMLVPAGRPEAGAGSAAEARVDPSGPWLELGGMFPVSVSGVQPGDATAEICLDPSERKLYVGVRGSDRICRLSLDAEGLPRADAEFPCGGEWPRHHCLDGGRLVVALERSHALAMFDLGPDGSAMHPPRLLPIASPTCVLPHR